MSSGNKHPYPLLITIGAIAGLSVISFFQPVVSAGGHTFRPLDIFADLRSPVPITEPLADTVTLAGKDTASAADSFKAPHCLPATT